MPKRRSLRVSDQEDSGSRENVSMSQDMLTSILTTLQQSQAEFCRQLLREVRTSTPLQTDHAAAAAAAAASVSALTGNFSQCTSRYSGHEQEEESLEAFIDAIESYKSCLHISEDNALRGMSMLLTGQAAVWWQGVKVSISTWDEALAKLRSAFGERRPPFRIYKELFSLVQGNENTEFFIAKVRALLAKLPKDDLSEKVQIDMTFSLLDRRIRKRLERETVSSFDQLLKKCQSIEDSLKEVKCTSAQVKSTRASTTDRDKRSRPSGSQASAPVESSAAGSRVELHAGAAPVTSEQSSSSTENNNRARRKFKLKTEIKCYGCGTPNVIKSKCKKCSAGQDDSVSVSAFDAAAPVSTRAGGSCHDVSEPAAQHASTGARVREPRTAYGELAMPTYYRRPILNIGILGKSGTGLVDTGSKTCLAGHRLHSILRDLGHPLVPTTEIVRLADGVCREMNVLTTELEVTLKHKVKKIEFLVFPNSDNNVTLLGMDFLRKFNLNFDFSSNSWHFGENSSKRFQIQFENVSPQASCAVVNVLREDEATHLDARQCAVLSRLLVENQDMFEPGGEATPFAEHRIDTRDHSPIAVPHYPITPAKKELLRAEIDKMLEDDIIEECESAALLLPKANDKVKYQGHVISQDGIAPDDEKVRAVLDMRPPTSLRHLRTFLQTCSRFRKFIPNFAAVAEPLTRLTKKNQVWIWSSEQVNAFEELKRRLTSAPILVQADYSKPFVLRTDASNYALGAVLLQGDDAKDERPVEYASRLLTSAERNYSTTEREALAVVWAVEKFRGYIEGHPVVIGSDHQPLKWLLTLKSPSGRLVRWALKLQSFNIQFEYTPGKANVVADTLSRPTCEENGKDQCGMCSVVVDLPARSPEDLRRAQLDDPDLVKIVSQLELSSDAGAVDAKRWSERGYFMQQGVLYRYNPDVDSDEPQLVVPGALQHDILKECHDSSIAGHQGIERTFSRVAQRFYFPGMRRIIAEYIKTCVVCQRYKASNEKPSGLLQTPVLNQRGEVLAVDLFGPLPPGEKGERWVLLVEDTATRWVELFALKDATSEVCAKVLIEEYFLRYGLPRRVVSDNGVQFVSAVMQQCMYILGVEQDLLPLYHPEANPAERKNRDMKVQLSQLVEMQHNTWPLHLSSVRFAMNSACCQTTGVTPAYLMFARELRSPLQVRNDIRAVLRKDNFVPQITPYLKSFVNSLISIRDRVEAQQDRRKEYADQSRKPGEVFSVGDQVLVMSRVLSNAAKNVTAKFIPKRDGPYVVVKKASPTTYVISKVDAPDEVVGRFHASQLVRFHSRDGSPLAPVVPRRRRGRPRQHEQIVERVQGRGRPDELEGEDVACGHSRLPPRANRGRLPVRFVNESE